MLYILPISQMQLFCFFYYLLYASYYMLHYRRRTKLLTNLRPFGLFYYFAIHATLLHALLQATYSTFILASPDSVRLTGLLCRISHRISTDTFLSCTLILTPLKTFILYFMLDIFCLASIHANRCQYQRSDLLQCFLITA